MNVIHEQSLSTFHVPKIKESVCNDANTLRNIQVLFLVQVVLSGCVYSRIPEFVLYIRCPFSCLTARYSIGELKSFKSRCYSYNNPRL